MTPPSDRRTSILIGASSFTDARAALRLLGRLLGDWQPSLGGVLVEDAASIAICSLPNQRIVTPSGTVALAPTRSQLGTMIEADARAFKKSLASLAGDVGATWTFERNTGDLVQTSLHMAMTWDILVFAHRKIHPVAGNVVVLEPAESTDSPMREMSKQLAQQLAADRVFLSVGGAGRGSPADDASDIQRVATLDDALARLARWNSQAVLVDLSRGPVRSSDELRRLIEVARCPVFVFGAMSADQMLEHTTQIPPAPDTGNSAGEK